MKYQRGLTLTGLIAWGVVIFLVAVLAVKVVPEVIDFYKIKKAVASTAMQSRGKTVPEIRADFDRHANIDSINTIKGSDLDIYKEGSVVVVAFAYETRISLFYNVSLVIDFQGSSRQNE
jgi:hypothetical protein